MESIHNLIFTSCFDSRHKKFLAICKKLFVEKFGVKFLVSFERLGTATLNYISDSPVQLLLGTA